MNWEVFYTPHTDDETIAMGGAIVRARSVGHNVMVVLVTDNKPSTYMRRVFNRVDLHSERQIEFERALSILGVNEIRYWDLPESLATTDPFALQAMIERQMDGLHNELRPLQHHTVWGLFDVNLICGFGSIAHGLCANALNRVAWRVRTVCASLYGVYVYSLPMSERCAPKIDTLTEREFQIKRRALECYKEGDGSIGYGYRSVPELIDHASIDPREFVMEIPSVA